MKIERARLKHNNQRNAEIKCVRGWKILLFSNTVVEEGLRGEGFVRRAASGLRCEEAPEDEVSLT